jgi:RNA polymerase sigma-70 factor, ECF subfamily
MEASSTHQITGLLRAWSAGDEKSLDALVPLVYAQLRRAAHRYMVDERSNHTLQTTALVHEVYLRLVDVQQVTWQDRTHFMAMCARLMRRVLVDFARSKNYQKRGGGQLGVSLDEAAAITAVPNMVALDEALERLAAIDERKGKVVELRFFGGLSVQESADVLKVSPETVMRDWKMAKVWLMRELDEGSNER